jgi:hypothetical protein
LDNNSIRKNSKITSLESPEFAEVHKYEAREQLAALADRSSRTTHFIVFEALSSRLESHQTSIKCGRSPTNRTLEGIRAYPSKPLGLSGVEVVVMR